ncbi:Crp/Fnr family transcriptional regulator [Candidatus Kapabacteria bacterium]|nr:Crp/Fnr family transcriptional regulator [Candidatus Kapabacteria bacterium]
MEEFFKYLNTFIKLDNKLIEMFSEVFTVRNFKKREVIQKEGDIATKFYFNVKGFVRLYYLADGDEKTAFFYPKNHFVSDFESYVRETPSKINFQAMEDTQLIEITKDAANKGLELSKEFQSLAIILMEEEMIVNQQMIRSFLTRTPEQRYFDLLKDSPEIIQKVPQQHIASYLRITPESLSRLKNKHYKNS